MTSALPQEHSDIVGGSSAARMINCPGHYSLKPLAPPDSGSDYADEGTVLHDTISRILSGEYEDDRDAIGKTFGGFEKDGRKMPEIEMTEELFAECMQPCLDLMDALNHEAARSGGAFEYYVEVRGAMPGIDGAFGTCDIGGRMPDKTVLIDWKFGRGVTVDVEDNEQLMFYGRALLHEMPDLFGEDDDWPVELWICQPRRGDPQSHTVTVRDLKNFHKELLGAVKNAKSKEPRFEEGKHCTFCKVQPWCPLKGGKVTHAMGQLRQKILDKMEPHKIVLNKDGIKRLLNYLEIVDDLEEWCKSVRAVGHAVLEIDSRALGGHWKLEPKKSKGRIWTGDEATTVAGLRALGVPKKDMYSKPALITPPAAEGVLVKRGYKKADAAEVLKELAAAAPSSGFNMVKGDGTLPEADGIAGSAKLGKLLGAKKKGKTN